MVPMRARKPEWLKVRSPGGSEYLRLKGLMRSQALHTVCEEAGCPNIGECWEAGTATFMILGDVCTRACKYCGVAHGMPMGLDRGEPRRVAATVAAMRCVVPPEAKPSSTKKNSPIPSAPQKSGPLEADLARSWS